MMALRSVHLTHSVLLGSDLLRSRSPKRPDTDFPVVPAHPARSGGSRTRWSAGPGSTADRSERPRALEARQRQAWPPRSVGRWPRRALKSTCFTWAHSLSTMPGTSSGSETPNRGLEVRAEVHVVRHHLQAARACSVASRAPGLTTSRLRAHGGGRSRRPSPGAFLETRSLPMSRRSCPFSFRATPIRRTCCDASRIPLRPETSRVNRAQIWTVFLSPFSVWVHREARIQRLAITPRSSRWSRETRVSPHSNRIKGIGPTPPPSSSSLPSPPLPVIATSPEESLLAWASPIRVWVLILVTRRSRRAHRPVRCRCCAGDSIDRGSGKPVQNGPGPRLVATRSAEDHADKQK